MDAVLVAGAGPAGALAALTLARAGVRVTMIDRARFPRPKLCGDTVNPGALAILKRLGLMAAVDGGLRVDGMLVTGEAGVRVGGSYGGGHHGMSLTRRVLDARLVEAAVAAGAALEEGVVVRGPLLSADGRRVLGLDLVLASGKSEQRLAAITIAADGRASRVARPLRLSRTPASPRRWAIGSIFDGVTGLSPFGEMHVRRDCYIGVAPLPGGSANGCVVTADRETLRDPGLLLNTLRNDHATGARFVNAAMLAPATILGPLALDAGTAGMPGLLLAGDAAGFIDPMTGDGLRFAFRGGELAGEYALRGLTRPDAAVHELLHDARRTEFAAKWRFNRLLRALASSPRALRAAGAGAGLSPALLRHVIRYAGDVRAA